MTLHWWMHWFWITGFAVVLPALLLTATPIRTAPAPTAEFLGYSSPLPSYEEDFDVIHPEAEVLAAATVNEEAGEEPLDDISWPHESLPDATIGEEIREPVREHHHVAPYGQLRNEEFTTYLPSPCPSTEEKQIRLADVYSVPTDEGRSVTEDIPAVSGDDEQGQDFPTGVPSNGDVVESDSVGSEAEMLPVPSVAQTTIITPEDISVRENNPEPSLAPPVEPETSSLPLAVSEGPSVSIGDSVVNSRSQGIDKPLVNVPHSVTRDLKNSSVADTPGRRSDTESIAAAAEGGAKSALTFHSSLHEPQYPQLSLDEEGHIAHSDRSAKAALVFHSPQIIAVATTTTAQPGTANKETADDLLRSKDSADVSILPSSAGQTGRDVLQQLQEQVTGDHLPGVLSQPSEKPEVDGESEASKAKDAQESIVSSQKKLKVIPPLMPRASANTSASQTGRVLTDNGSSHGSGYTPPLITEAGVNVVSTANVTEDPGIVVATTPESSPAVTGKKEPTVSPTVVSDDMNMVPTVLNDENETSIEVTAVPSVIPVSKGRVAAAVPTGSQGGLDAASITGISLGILVFAALVGAVSFVLYRRRFLNKPQTLNDKCSNPDSSGYIDDSTLRENSEEMYSLDNDSFLNSLEAMTIQNYWTDNVKHTKL